MNCPKKAGLLARDWHEKKQFGIWHDGTRFSPPKNCTPLMSQKKMIPLSKRKSAGVNRERYMDVDCNVYEWDYQHGRFEKYALSGSSTLVHVGEVSPVYGVDFEHKVDPRRNYTDTTTGIDGYSIKNLCKDHSRGTLPGRVIQRSMDKRALLCL